jgi:hypothetical protein
MFFLEYKIYCNRIPHDDHVMMFPHFCARDLEIFTGDFIFVILIGGAKAKIENGD